MGYPLFFLDKSMENNGDIDFIQEGSVCLVIDDNKKFCLNQYLGWITPMPHFTPSDLLKTRRSGISLIPFDQAQLRSTRRITDSPISYFFGQRPRRGRSPVEHRGTFVRHSIHLSVHSPRPSQAWNLPFRPKIYLLRPGICPPRPWICESKFKAWEDSFQGLRVQITGLRGRF